MRWVVLVAIMGAVLLYPSQWLPKSTRLQLAEWLGTDTYRPLPGSQVTPLGEAWLTV